MKYFSLKTATPVSSLDVESVLGSKGATILRLDNDGKSSTVYFAASDAKHAKTVESAMSVKSKAELKEVSDKDVATLK
jgi:hypothetical protein